MIAKYQFVADHASLYPVACLCRVLGVARSGYYAWRKRSQSQRSQANRTLLEQIRRIHVASRGTYGSPRIHAELRAQGSCCSRKRVARVMRLAGMAGKCPRRRTCTTDGTHAWPIAANTLNRKFAATMPNMKWAADITYIATREGWLYLAVVMDLFSRRIIGWSMRTTLACDLVLAALQMALQQRSYNQHLIHHSDRGSQYASADYQRRLAATGIQCSMSRKGNCYDNAVVESFFGTLKTELVADQTFLTRAEARQAIFEYIEVFYNRQRRHSALDYLSPAEYEARYREILGSVQAA